MCRHRRRLVRVTVFYWCRSLTSVVAQETVAVEPRSPPDRNGTCPWLDKSGGPAQPQRAPMSEYFHVTSQKHMCTYSLCRRMMSPHTQVLYSVILRHFTLKSLSQIVVVTMHENVLSIALKVLNLQSIFTSFC